MNRKIRIQRLAPQDRDLWQKLYYRHKAQRQRRRLSALKAIWDGQTLAAVCRSQNVHRHSLEHWIDLYLHGGFDALLAPERRAVPQALSATRRKVLHHILPHKRPRKSKNNPKPKLTAAQIKHNRQHAGTRVSVEHSIGGMKAFHCLTHRIRNHLDSLIEYLFWLPAGLWNLKIA